MTDPTFLDEPSFIDVLKRGLRHRLLEFAGLVLLIIVGAAAATLASWSIADPSLSHATANDPQNWLGRPGAIASDLMIQLLGIGSGLFLLPPLAWALRLFSHRGLPHRFKSPVWWLVGTVAGAAALSAFPIIGTWPLPTGLGGLFGDSILLYPEAFFAAFLGGFGTVVAGIIFAGIALGFLWTAAGLPGAAVFSLLERRHDDESEIDEDDRAPIVIANPNPEPEPDWEEDETPNRGINIVGAAMHTVLSTRAALKRNLAKTSLTPRGLARAVRDTLADDGEPIIPITDRVEPVLADTDAVVADEWDDEIETEFTVDDETIIRPPNAPKQRVKPQVGALKKSKRAAREAQPTLWPSESFQLPPLHLLNEPKVVSEDASMSEDALEQNARLLEGVLDDFGVRGEIVQVRPGPVVTLYELEPAPGTKSSRVIGLADDIARSMSAISARVSVIPGRNAIGIELPNSTRQTVYLREQLASRDFEGSKSRIALSLGKTIGGEPVIADLARMPHLLIAGTTGSGKSVAINTMILSVLYRMTPEQCRMIMIDPKMLELSVYDGIPHLLSPVVTDPKKAVVALKWTVREMEDRYKKMSKLGVRNIDGFNTRVAQAQKKGEVITRTVQTGFNRETGEAIFETEELDLEPMPFIVVVIDEMADLMMVAGKDIEGAVQRLAQMARAAGIHVIMATQRPSVDVITGTIKANFPTRISFQVTSKIDSRTILGEMGAEQLLGQGDMLFMAGGGRIKRVHGPFVSDEEVEEVVAFLKAQGTPEYLDAITEEVEDEEGGGGIDGLSALSESNDLYDKAVAIVLRDKKASTSYVQRRLSIGYNRAASLIERMEQEGVISAANHAGKREILVDNNQPEDHL